jgi:hypothetical protein
MNVHLNFRWTINRWLDKDDQTNSIELTAVSSILQKIKIK